MNRTIPIKISKKIASIVDRNSYYVCGNDDFKVVFDFDDDWEKHSVKTARFSYEGKYQDVVFVGNECYIPIIIGAKYIDVGVFACDLSSSTPTRIRAKESIVDIEGLPEDPLPDVYTQIMEKLDEIETGGGGGTSVKIDKTLTQEGQAADAKAVGDAIVKMTPVKGKDYWTDEDKAEIKGYVDEAILGGAW